jgi:hypothetical protein
MSTVGEMSNRKDRPAYVRFERRAIEDRTVKSVDGRWPKRDVDFVLVTPPYSRDVFEQEAPAWFAQMQAEVNNNRLPEEWYDRYVKAYDKWKTGQEMPLDGEPIKGWGVLSPAQQSNLIAMNVLTVEDLAAVNDEGLRRIGMGASELRTKAKAWLAQMKDKGPLTQKMAALESENIALKASNENLERRVKELSAQVEAIQRGGLQPQHFSPQQQIETGISASDILPEPPVASRKRADKSAPI